MIIQIPYKSKKDGTVKLIKRISGIYSEDGKTIIPTGFKIRKISTNEFFDEAIDISDASFVYEETNEPIEKPEDVLEKMNEIEEKVQDYPDICGV